MKKIIIYPDRLKHFGSITGASFYLVTNKKMTSHFILAESNLYSDATILAYDTETEFVALLDKMSPHAHILVISPDCYFQSPKKGLLGKQRKLIVMANNSTPSSLEAIEHFLRCGENADPTLLDLRANELFDAMENSTSLIFVDSRYQCKATLNHLSKELQWHQQAGILDWGEQQLFPSGEVSVLPLDVYEMDIQSSFELNGEIVLQGIPVLHSGLGSFLPQDQQRIFSDLNHLQHSPIYLKVENGIITQLEGINSKNSPALSMLRALIAMDSRYAVMIEIGFGLNHWLRLFSGNAAMNEVYATSPSGTVHFGLGLTPFTQYHLDLICPYTEVFNQNNERLFGDSNFAKSSIKEENCVHLQQVC